MFKNIIKPQYLFLFLAVFLNACIKNDSSVNNDNNKGDPSPMKKMSYLALGDSYTIGQSVEVNQRWPVQLVDTLRLSGIGLEGAEIIAQTGWTTGELMQAIESADPQGPYDMVSLLIGVNNQYRHLDTGMYRTELRALMETAIQFAGNDAGRVIIVSIPDYGVTPFAQNMDPDRIAEEINSFNAIKREESEKLGLYFMDVTLISRMAASDPELLAEDSLHPSGKMYAEWVKLIFPVAKGILTNN